MRINETRFLENMRKSSSIGSTDNNGLHRLALSKEDQQMRDVYVNLLEESNLTVRIDDFGNIYGRREGKNKDAPAVTLGSHLDTQPYGGRFDGVLGVLAGLEVIETLNDHGILTDHPIELINFTNEEGARFNPPLLGSGAVTGKFDKNYVYDIKDDHDISFENALSEIKYMGLEENRLNNVKSYVELHIEQGPILEQDDKDIGIVQGIQGLTRINVKVIGSTNHAGGARMKGRRDALLTASHMVIAVNEVTQEVPGLRVTVGKIENYPNVINVIPGHVEFVIDVRHAQDKKKNQSVSLIEEKLQAIAEELRVECEMHRDWAYDTAYFDQQILHSIKDATEELDYSYMSLYGGPGHDAMYMNSYTPTAMIFVESVAGISHNEAELTENADLIKGANVLLHSILKLANS